jgi:hypothetical protein
MFGNREIMWEIKSYANGWNIQYIVVLWRLLNLFIDI